MKSWNGPTEEKVKEEIVCEDPGARIKLIYIHINLTPPVSQIPIDLTTYHLPFKYLPMNSGFRLI